MTHPDASKKPSRHAQRRRAAAVDWCCQRCKHPASGEAWWNRARADSCKKCGVAKASSFAHVRPKPAAPSKRGPGAPGGAGPP
eukprot:7568476-Pyramimonas_sp.AAC.1